MSQCSKLLIPLVLAFDISSIKAFAPCNRRTSPPSGALSAQRQSDKKRRFLQSAHPIPPKTSANNKSDTNTANHQTNRWNTPNGVTQKKPTAAVQSSGGRIKPPLQTSKSIEELEKILEKRWGTADDRKASSGGSDDMDFVMSFDEEKPISTASKTVPRGASVLRSRRVKDPWERSEKIKQKYDHDDEASVSEEDTPKTDRLYNRDAAMLKRVRTNQLRLNKKGRKDSQRENDQTYDISIDSKDYYDQDDEGYENEGTMISPRPVGGSGKTSAALEAGIFSTRNGNRGPKRADVTATTATSDFISTSKMMKDKNKKRPKQRQPQLEPMLDEDGNPMYLTLDQAEKVVENILSSDEGTTSFDADTVEWQDVGITNPQLLNNLQSSEMVCPSPLEVQIKACPPIVAGNDVLLSTHTGSGKTLAFLTPIAQNIMMNPSNSPLPKALIVAPGRELASQISSVAQKLFVDTGLTVAMLIGGTSYARSVDMLRSKRPDVVVGTPGRIAELILGRSGDKGGKLKISNLQTLVLDEFDALLQYDAHKEPTAAIIEAIDRQHGQSLQRVLCSATACDMMSESENARVNNYLRPGFAHASIDETDLLVTSGKKANAIRVSKTTIHGTLHVAHQRLALEAVRRILNTDPVVQQALIFVDSPRRVDIVIEKLARMDVIAAPLHGGGGKEDRAEVSKALREGFVGVVVATEMAARGLDAPYLTHVINLDLPTDASHYAHRSGRCGRGGRPGVAISITCNDRERGVPKKFAEELGITMYDVEAREGKMHIVKR